MPPDLALLSTLIGSNYPCLKLIILVPQVFEPLKFYCNLKASQRRYIFYQIIKQQFTDSRVKSIENSI